MDNKASLFIELLRKEGHRITNVRQAMIELFATAHSPLSVLELGEALNSEGMEPNKTTIYREIEFFLEKEFIKEIDLLDGKKRYELSTEGHHHHFFCNNCKKIFCIDMERDLDELEKKLSKKFKFQIESHVLEFFGKCEECGN